MRTWNCFTICNWFYFRRTLDEGRSATSAEAGAEAGAEAAAEATAEKEATPRNIQ